jgi:hypothetical protein
VPIELSNDMLASGYDSGCAPSTRYEGRQPSSFPLLPCIRCWALSNLPLGQAAFRGRNRDNFLRELDARNAPVQFDEREEETALCQTGLRRPGENLTNRHREANVTAPLLDSTH